MHRAYRTLTILLCCILLLTFGCLPIAAAEDCLRQNQIAADETAASLSALITEYDEKEASSTIPADRAIEVIGHYAAEAAALIPSNMTAARTEDLRPAFSLLYTKASLSAKLSWITYVHEAIDEQNTDDAVREQYRALCEEIRMATDENTLIAHADDICVRMNRAVFKQKIHALPGALGMEETHVLEHLQKALLDIDRIASSDINGAAYLAVYESARAAIILEQHRLQAKEEFGNAYDLLGLPSADKLSALSALSAVLSDATSTEEINRAVLNATTTCLQTALPGNTLYTSAYRQALIAAMESAVTAAENTAVAHLCPYLDGTDDMFSGKPFTERAQIVFAKDRIEALRLPSDDAALCNLLNAYVQSGGILDRCESREALDFEVLRATHRAAWARQKNEHLKKIEEILPTASAGALLAQVKTIYAEVDDAICSLSITTENADAALEALLAAGSLRIDEPLREAEAERFRVTHADILKDTDPREEDRPRLEAAITALDALSDKTRKKLDAEIKILNDHYKTLTVQKIRSYLCDDSCAELRRSAFEQLVADVERLSSEDTLPSSLRITANRYCVRAEAIDALLDCYHTVRTAPHYAQYDSNSVAALQSTVADAIRRLLDPSQTGVDDAVQDPMRPTVADTLSNAILTLERRCAIAEIRLAAGGSTLPTIHTLVETASDAIIKATDPAVIGELRDSTVFRISACRKADEMRHELAVLKAEIAALRALSGNEKETLLQSDAMLALTEACTRAEQATDGTALAEIAVQFAEAKQQLKETAEEQALAAGIRAAIAEVTKTADAFRTQLHTYQYLSGDARQAYTERLENLVAAWTANVRGATAWEPLDELLIEIRESLSGLAAHAEADEEKACRQSLLSLWQARFDRPDYYSDEPYSRVCALLTEAENLLKETSGISALHVLRDTVITRLEQIPTRLDEAKSEAIKAMEAAYAEVSKNKMCYSTEAWGKIEEILLNSMDRIGSLRQISDADFALNIAKDYILSLQSVRMDKLYSYELENRDEKLPHAYPQGYDADTSGYWAVLSAPNALPFDSRFSATAFSATDMTGTLRAAVRRGAIVDAYGNELSDELLQALRHGTVLNGLSLSYTASLSPDVPYRISLLLPNDCAVQDMLGIIFIREDGCVEFFDCNIDDNIISFDITHFSDFYIVSESAINLVPLIVILTLILLCEIIAILWILARRKAANAPIALAAYLPIAPISLARRITPTGGIPAVIILGLCVIAATLTLAWLLIDERERRAVSTAEQALLVSKNDIKSSTPAQIASADPEKAMAQKALPSHDPLPTVTAELANEIMSDEEAAKATEIAPRQSGADILRPIGKRTAINIDVISKHFQANETVSLSSLKEHGLIAKNTRAIKILARGTLDKPLTVIANDFSATAIKMILLTGGEAILVEKERVE